MVVASVHTGLGSQEEMVYIARLPSLGEKHFRQVRVGQLSRCSDVLLLPLGVPQCRSWRASHNVFPMTASFGGCSPPQMMWPIIHRGRGQGRGIPAIAVRVLLAQGLSPRTALRRKIHSKVVAAAPSISTEAHEDL